MKCVETGQNCTTVPCASCPHAPRPEPTTAGLTLFQCKLDKSSCDHDWLYGDGRMDDRCKLCDQRFGAYIHMECL